MLRLLSLYLWLGLAATARAQEPNTREQAKAQQQAREAVREAERQASAPPLKEVLRTDQEALRAIPGTAANPRFDLPNPALTRPVLRDGEPRDWSLAEASPPPPLLVLVSFSMPESELRSLAEDAAKLPAPLVLRGLVNDSMEETAKRVAALSKQAGVGFAIDPTLFSRFDADRVPTLILPLEPLRACTADACPAPAHVRVTGVASLSYLLEQFERRATQPRAREQAKALRLKLRAP